MPWYPPAQPQGNVNKAVQALTSLMRAVEATAPGRRYQSGKALQWLEQQSPG